MASLKHIIGFLLLVSVSFSQNDSVVGEKHLNVISLEPDQVPKLNRDKDTADDRVLIVSGYVSAYYAHYDDESVDNNGFAKFAAVAPRPQQFGLNMALISMKYNGRNVRSSLGIHFGDIPKAVWPNEFNMIQEANAGFKLSKKLWIDAGFFRSHIGVESTQPRENIATSMSLVNNYEPYYLAGAKLTYRIHEKISLQLNAFNSFNSYVETNKNTLVGTSIVIDANEFTSVTYNFITGDDSPTGVRIKRQRFYNNFCATYKKNKLYLGFEFNYGVQQHSKTNDTTASATVLSALIVGKYQVHKKAGIYGRQEYFSDPDNMLTETISTGKQVHGTTLGAEYKPFKNVALSTEGRILQTENLIFKQGSFLTNQRFEFIICLDLWF